MRNVVKSALKRNVITGCSPFYSKFEGGKKLLVLLCTIIICLFSTNVKAMDFAFPSEDSSSGIINQSKEVNGNFLGAANKIILDSNIGDDAFLFANSITQNGKVLGNLFIGAQFVDVTNEVGRDLFVGAYDISIGEKSIINGSAYLGSKSQTISGTIKGNLYSGATNLEINGTIEGDIHANVENLSLGSQSTIKGKIYYTSNNEIKISEGAKYGSVEKKSPSSVSSSDNFKNTLNAKLLALFSTLLIGAVIITLFSKKSTQIAQNITTKFWSSLGWGFVVLFVVPIICLVLLITLIGAQLSLLVMAIYILLIGLTKIFAGLALGNLLCKNKWSLIWSITLGTVVLTIISLIPYLSEVTTFLVLLLGLGSIFLVIKDAFAKK
ncbi:MAG: hypothetical protein ACD_58C00324G0006 [uncultured bacterium]|nr:MAG: hypothetical protein ACD_58C00324G0006 [uncultured bacterium]